ncbi:hypothetical protein ACFX1S_044539 [Malus domestica]
MNQWLFYHLLCFFLFRLPSRPLATVLASFTLPRNSTNGALLGGQLAKRHGHMFAKAPSYLYAAIEDFDTVNIAEDVTQHAFQTFSAISPCPLLSPHVHLVIYKP